MKDLKNKVAVVTGAASGIGRALAVRLADEGCQVALLDINMEALAETARMAEQKKATVSTHRVDVSDREQFQDAANKIIEQFGRVDIIINNAGVSLTGSFKNVSFKDLEWITSVNYWGVVNGMKIFLPHMVERNEGHIVNVSSSAGYIAMANWGIYCATKYAVRANGTYLSCKS